MKTFADLKRALKEGTRIVMYGRIPEWTTGKASALIGRPGTITKVQTNGIYIKRENERDVANEKAHRWGSWLDFPPARHVIIDSPTEFTFCYPDPDGTVRLMLKYRIIN